MATSGSASSSSSSSGEEGRKRIRWACSARPASPAGVSTATTRPASMSATRSHSRSASSMKCVTSTTVTPASRTCSTRSQVVRRACGSSPVVSSSRTTTRGIADHGQRDGQALLLAAGEVLVAGPGLAAQAQPLHQRDGVGGALVEGGEEGERLADGELVGQAALLELHAEHLAQRVAVASRVEAEDGHLAAVGAAQAGHALDGGGLARAVRAEDAEDLALLDGERHVVDRDVRAVPLVEVCDLDDLHVRAPFRRPCGACRPPVPRLPPRGGRADRPAGSRAAPVRWTRPSTDRLIQPRPTRRESRRRAEVRHRGPNCGA